MPNRDRYTQAQVIDAIKAAKGIKATAAEGLGCSRQTITNYIDRYPAVKAAYQEARDSSLDLAESKLIALVEREEWPAIRFMLVTLGKDRGFTERTETSSPTARKGIQTPDGDVDAIRGREARTTARLPVGATRFPWESCGRPELKADWYLDKSNISAIMIIRR